MQGINKKGQALVEFVLILPILIMIIGAIIDIGSIYYQKNHLEGVLNTSVNYLLNGKTSNEIESLIDDDSIKINITYEDETATIELSKKVNLITPFISAIIDNPYNIETKRVVLYE